jgi:hypothetical protein
MRKNNENSVLFSIGSVIEMAHQKERERSENLAQQAAERERAETERLDQARQRAEETDQARLAAAAETARHDREIQVAEKEAALLARIEADTQRELEMLRAEYRDGAPVVVPGRRRLSFAVANLVTLAVFGLGAFGVHAMANDNQPPTTNAATASSATPRNATQHTPQIAPKPELATPAPVTTVTQPKPVVVQVKKPVRKPIIKRPVRPRPRCRWITTTKRVQNELWNHPLNFEGRYKIIKKRIKKCRK